MKAINIKNTIGKGFLVLSLLFGIGIATSVTTQAQWRDNDQSRRSRDYEREQRRRERERIREQRRNERRNEGYYGNNGGYNNDGSYNNGGYNNGGYYGNNGDRRNDGYRNYGGSFDLRQTALNAGANDGVKEGRKDRQNGDRFNYTDEGSYQNATHDYSSRLGDRSIYQRYYRDAFINGYTEGYRGY